MRKITEFNYKFGEHKSKGKLRPRDTFYAEMDVPYGKGIEAGALLTVYGDPNEKDEIDWKLFGGEHPSKGTIEKKKGGQCYAVGRSFRRRSCTLKRISKTSNDKKSTEYIIIENGMPKNLGDVRKKKIRLVARVIPNVEEKYTTIECAVDIFDSNGTRTWFSV